MNRALPVKSTENASAVDCVSIDSVEMHAYALGPDADSNLSAPLVYGESSPGNM